MVTFSELVEHVGGDRARLKGWLDRGFIKGDMGRPGGWRDFPVGEVIKAAMLTRFEGLSGLTLRDFADVFGKIDERGDFSQALLSYKPFYMVVYKNDRELEWMGYSSLVDALKEVERLAEVRDPGFIIVLPLGPVMDRFRKWIADQRALEAASHQTGKTFGEEGGAK